MNNIELRLYAERNWREESYLQTKHFREQNTIKTFVSDIMNHYPVIMAKALWNTSISGIFSKKNLPARDAYHPCQERTAGLLHFLSKKKSIVLPR